MFNSAVVPGRIGKKPKRAGLLLEYALAVLLVAFATAARSWLDPYLKDGMTYVTFLLANTIVIGLTGLGPSLLAIGLSTWAADYFFMAPRYSFAMNTAQAIASAAFVLANLAILVLAHTMRSAKIQAEAYAARLKKAKEDSELQLAERHRAEVALRVSEARYRSLFMNMLEGCAYCQMIVDEQGRPQDFVYLEVNDSFERVTGLKAVTGKKVTEAIPGIKEAHPELFEIYGRVAAGGPPESFEIEFKPHGIWLTVSVFSPAKGHFVAVFDNITERKEMIEALTEAKETLRHHADHLERIVAARTAKLQDSLSELEHFSYTLSHDLRSPLRAMRGFSDLMLQSGCETCKNSTARNFLQRVMAGAERLDMLIHDALEYHRAASKELPLVPVDVASLLRGMLKSYPNLQPMHAEISLEGEFPAVLGNEAALAQCFSNLLGNAVKFVAPGVKPRIRIWAEELHGPEPSTINQPQIRICIEDNGIGIAPEDQKKLFGIFQRMNSQYEGTGIGLALVRKNMEKMGGKVGVESELGKGSRFWLELNSAAQTGAEQYLLPLQTAGRYRVAHPGGGL